MWDADEGEPRKYADTGAPGGEAIPAPEGGTAPGEGTPAGAGTTPVGGTTTGTWTGSGTRTTTETGSTPGAETAPGSKSIRKRINLFPATVEPAKCDKEAGQLARVKTTPEGVIASRAGATLRSPEPGVEAAPAVDCPDEASQSADPDKASGQGLDQVVCVVLDPCADQNLNLPR